jgi:hypothetical protein
MMPASGTSEAAARDKHQGDSGLIVCRNPRDRRRNEQDVQAVRKERARER